MKYQKKMKRKLTYRKKSLKPVKSRQKSLHTVEKCLKSFMVTNENNTNEKILFFIGQSLGSKLSSIVNEVIRTIFLFVYFFYEEILNPKESVKTQNKQFFSLMKFLCTKNSCFCRFLFACCVVLVGFYFFCVFHA